MSEIKHTPGPWSISRSKMPIDGTFDYAISAEGAPVLAEAFGRTSDGGWPNSEANARLIAAAPDMLDKGKALADRDCTFDGSNIVIPCGSHSEALRVMQEFRSALAKAEGRS